MQPENAGLPEIAHPMRHESAAGKKTVRIAGHGIVLVAANLSERSLSDYDQRPEPPMGSRWRLYPAGVWFTALRITVLDTRQSLSRGRVDLVFLLSGRFRALLCNLRAQTLVLDQQLAHV